MMIFRLALAVVTMTAGFAASQACAQNATQTTTPVANTAAKQDKQAVTPPAQAAAPKSAPARAEKKPAAANAKPADAAAPAPRPATVNAPSKDVPRIQPSPLGRVPVDNKGTTFGFSSETKMNMYATPDGQRIRGLDHAITSTRQPNYFGLSLSVPTTGNPFGGDARPGFPPPRD
jgi:hypothetical protein